MFIQKIIWINLVLSCLEKSVFCYFLNDFSPFLIYTPNVTTEQQIYMLNQDALLYELQAILCIIALSKSLLSHQLMLEIFENHLYPLKSITKCLEYFALVGSKNK